MYWTEGGANPRIARLSISSNSSLPETLISLPASSIPTGIVINYLHNKLLWADQSNGTVHMSNFDGSDQVLMFHASHKRILNLALIGDTLYWTTKNSNQYSSTSLFDTTDINSYSILGVPYYLTRLYGIATFDVNKQIGNGELFYIFYQLQYLHTCIYLGYHVCLLNGMSCSHYCAVDKQGKAVCSCPAGYVLLPDNVTCASKFL